MILNETYCKVYEVNICLTGLQFIVVYLHYLLMFFWSMPLRYFMWVLVITAWCILKLLLEDMASRYGG